MSETFPPPPWHAFFLDLDDALSGAARLDCIGGFVVTAMQGGPLHRKHRIYLDRVGVAAVPENYGERMSQMFPGTYRNFRLLALDPYDIALSKLERNSQKDRDDVRFLASRVPFDLRILEQRYRDELRWQLGRPDREDLTMALWMEMLSE